jgi:hypothetical protein
MLSLAAVLSRTIPGPVSANPSLADPVVLPGERYAKRAAPTESASGPPAKKAASHDEDEEIEKTGGGLPMSLLLDMFPHLRAIASAPALPPSPAAEAPPPPVSAAETMASAASVMPEVAAFRLQFKQAVAAAAAAIMPGKSPSETATSSGARPSHFYAAGVAHSKATWESIPRANELMTATAAALYFSGRRASTLGSQRSALRSWLYFADVFGHEAYPATESSLINFSVWSCTRIAPKSISKYIDSIRSAHVDEGVEMPTSKQMPRLARVMAGLEWIYLAHKGSRLRLPCTNQVLRRVVVAKAQAAEALPVADRPSVYSLQSPCFSAAVYSTAFCGGFRPSEISTRKNVLKGYTSLPLRLKDVSFNFDEYGEVLSVIIWLPHRKNDQAGIKSDVAIGRTGDVLVDCCTRLSEYLEERTAAGEKLTGDSFLFPVRNVSDDGLHGLTYEELTAAMHADLQRAGFDADLYNGHSWRIGMATTLALNGVPEYIIKDMGGWSRSSSAFNVYIGRAPQEQRMAFSAFLSQPYSAAAPAVAPEVFRTRRFQSGG